MMNELDKSLLEKIADLTGTPAATVTDGGTAEVVPGYYLIKDEDGSVTGNDAYTLYIVFTDSFLC